MSKNGATLNGEISDRGMVPFDPAPAQLRCEGLRTPLAIESRTPLFSWRLRTGAAGAKQTAYQILVGTDADAISRGEADLWDSGKVLSHQCTAVPYAGGGLASRQRCYWKVRIWDESHHATPYSESAYFETGLFEESDWTARWVGLPGGAAEKALYFRSSFTLHKLPDEARLYISGLGYYEPRMNGERLGETSLNPIYTDTARLVPYQAIDVTHNLVAGENVLAAIVGSGWHSCTMLRAQLEILDCGKWKIVSATVRQPDLSQWLLAYGPIVSNSLFDGETYDARLEKDGWDLPGYEMTEEGPRAGHWRQSYIVSGPSGKMQSPCMEPIGVIRTLTAAAITEPQPGVFVFDFGQNHAGWARIETEGPAGSAIRMRYAECLNQDGTVDQENLRGAEAIDRYILRGGGPEEWEPRFTYHGYRYVQVTGWPGRPDAASVVSRLVRSTVSLRSRFSCDQDILNRIHSLVLATEESNLHGLPTDCPQRDERMGWLNDLTVRAEELIYNFGCARFLRKFVQDIARAQDPETGAIPDTVPFHWGNIPADPVSASYLLIPILLFEHFGDISLLKEGYEGYKRWTDFLHRESKNHILSLSHYGDWAPPAAHSLVMENQLTPYSKDTPSEFISTAFSYYTTLLFSQIARIVGNHEDALCYESRAEAIKEAFHGHFWVEERSGYASGNQACNSAALYFHLVPDNLVPRVVNSLVRNIEENDFCLTTGNLCSKYVLEVLSREGHFDCALKIASGTKYPSWGFMLENGATTIWERWENLTGSGMNSHNHPMYGSIDAWFFRWVAGLQVTKSGHDNPHFTITIPESRVVTSSQARIDTPWGEASVSWKRANDITEATIVIPWNCSGSIRIGDIHQDLAPGEHQIRVDRQVAQRPTADRVHQILEPVY
jgi:alpha-L-rhamnosidase